MNLVKMIQKKKEEISWHEMRKTKYLNSNMNNSNFNSETQKCNKLPS